MCFNLYASYNKTMITGKQRSYLKGLAHDLDPIVYIGKAGLTENVINEIDDLLESRELIKVKLQDGAEEDPKTLANDVCEMLKAEFVQSIGRKFCVYRKAKKDPKIELPK